jgi:hypothetical protein
MNNKQQPLIARDKGRLQIPYEDYRTLMSKIEEARRIRETRDAVVAGLRGFLAGEPAVAPAEAFAPKREPAPAPAPEKVSVEFDHAEAKAESAPEPAAAQAATDPKAAAKTRKMAEGIDIPPIKKDIAVHFNKEDASGRLFSVFKQYYTCLNDACGGTVRVTMKDGFCSLWNYDEWEEFAFIDIFEGHLRVAVDPRYTDALSSQSFCEVPRLLSSRRNLVCVQVDDLNNTMLDVLAKAFEEVGLTAG